MASPIEALRETIKVINTGKPSYRFIPGRYPYTYAYDYVGEHYPSFQWDYMPSRAEVAQWLPTVYGDSIDEALQILAIAHCRQYGVAPQGAITREEYPELYAAIYEWVDLPHVEFALPDVGGSHG
jgi:hypothetical protein